MEINEEEEERTVKFLGILGIIKSALLIIPFSDRHFITAIILISLPLFASMVIYDVFIAQSLDPWSNDFDPSIFIKLDVDEAIKFMFHKLESTDFMQFKSLCHMTLWNLFDLILRVTTVYSASLIYAGGRRYTSYKEILRDSIMKPTWKHPIVVVIYTTALKFILMNVQSSWFNTLPFFTAINPLSFFVWLAVLYKMLVKGLEYKAKWSMGLVVSILEERNGFEAMLRSDKLIKGNVYRGSVLMYLLAAWDTLAYTLTKDKPERIAYALQTILMYVGKFIESLLIMVFYYDCRKRHGEKVDLQDYDDLLQTNPTGDKSAMKMIMETIGIMKSAMKMISPVNKNPGWLAISITLTLFFCANLVHQLFIQYDVVTYKGILDLAAALYYFFATQMFFRLITVKLVEVNILYIFVFDIVNFNLAAAIISSAAAQIYSNGRKIGRFPWAIFAFLYKSFWSYIFYIAVHSWVAAGPTLLNKDYFSGFMWFLILLIAFAKWLECTVKWNMGIVVAILEDVKIGFVSRSEKLIEGNKFQGSMLVLVYFVWWLVSIVLTQKEKGSFVERLGCALINASLMCAGNTMLWLVSVVYYYDCRKRRREVLASDLTTTQFAAENK